MAPKPPPHTKLRAALWLLALVAVAATQVVAAGALDFEQAGPPAELEQGPAAGHQQLDSEKRQFNGKNTQQQQQQQQQKGSQAIQKCARQSILLARQMLAHELAHVNQFNSIWFSDLDRDELLEGQKHSLSNIVMSGAGASLLTPNGAPLLEIESSYFRHASPTSSHMAQGAPQQQQQQQQPMAIKLLRRHQDRCYLNAEKRQFTYVVGLTLGPLEHYLDVVYNLPKELSLGQPLDWRYGQLCLSVPRMNYEVTLRQTMPAAPSGDSLQGIPTSGCALEIADVTYLAPGVGGGAAQQQQQHPPVTVRSFGLAVNNQTLLQVERLFDDYTRPTVSARLRQLLKFYLNTKTLPLAPYSDH